MKGQSTLLAAIVLLSLVSCKTQEDIRRERTVENLNEQIQQTQKTTASASSRFNTIEEQLARMNGQVEDMSHQRAQTIKEGQNLNERLNALEDANKKQVEYIKALTEKVNNQSGYIEEVIATLAKLTNEDKPSKKKTVSSSDEGVDITEDEAPTFDTAVKKFKAKDLDVAGDIFKKIAADKKAKKKEREGATHFLGMIEYKNKNYEEAKVYFSKLFSDNPKSTYASATLLNLARTFEKLKSNEEASLTLEELLNRFPNSKEADEASKLKAKLK